MTPTSGARPYRDLSDELTLRQLRSVSLFGGCTDAQLRDFSDRSIELRLAVGGVVVRASELADQVPIVLDGYAGAEAHGLPVIVLGPGAVIGGPEALDGALHPMTVIAQTPMVLRVISATDFSQIVATAPGFATALIRQLGGRTRTVLDELVCARQGFVTPRVGLISSAGEQGRAGPVNWTRT